LSGGRKEKQLSDESRKEKRLAEAAQRSQPFKNPSDSSLPGFDGQSKNSRSLDGFAARLLHQKTKIGAILDPAADKLLMTASFIILTIPAINSPNVIPSWLTISVIGRDLLIASAALVLYMLKGQKTFLPSLLGKTCTVLQVMVPLLVLLLNTRQISSPLLLWLYYLTLIFTFLSAVHYAFIGYRMLSQPREV